MIGRGFFLCAQGLLILLGASCSTAPPPCLSPDGRHQAQVEKRHGKWCVVRDGTVGRAYEQVFKGSLTFDGEGARLAYVAQEATARYLVVVDEVEGPRHDDVALSLVFSPDGWRLAYAAKDAGRWCVVLDEKPGRPHSMVHTQTMRFSGDGLRIAYAAQDSAGLFLWVEGRTEEAESYGPYEAIAAPAISHDGARLAYEIRRGGFWSMVVDDVEEMIAEGYGKGTPRFSADGTKVGYTALIEGSWFLVVDGEILAPIYGEVSERAFVAAIDEAFWSPALHRIETGISLLVADSHIRFTGIDGGHAINATVLELTPGPHAIILDYYSELGGRALDVDLTIDITDPGIHVLTTEYHQFGLGEQLGHDLTDAFALENLLFPFVTTRTVGKVSFGSMNVKQLAENYMANLVLTERKERQILGLLRQKWRPAEVRRVAADVAADMLAEGRLDRDLVVSVLAEVVSDQTDDRDLRQAIWKKLVELKLADAVREVPSDLNEEDPSAPGTGGDD